MILILLFILILNVVTIALTYYCLSEIEQKERFIFIGVGVAIIYMLTSVVYWFSTKNIAIKEVSETAKNLITFLFVPVNGFVVLPLLAKSYGRYKSGRLAGDKLRNRGIVLGEILLIILIIECSYFKDIQNSIIAKVEADRKNKTDIIQNENGNTLGNTQGNTILNEVNDLETNQIVLNTVNEI